MQQLAPVPPGELLRTEFLQPIGITPSLLAQRIYVPERRIRDIVAGKRAITADTDLRLSKFFGLSEGYWLSAQVAHDIEKARRDLKSALDRIQRWSA